MGSKRLKQTRAVTVVLSYLPPFPLRGNQNAFCIQRFEAHERSQSLANGCPVSTEENKKLSYFRRSYNQEDFLDGHDPYLDNTFE
jgi:hypothetical protein